MGENKTRKSSISNAKSLEEIGEFWDKQSLDTFWDETREVEFEVRAKLRRRVTLEPNIYQKLEDEAKIRGLVPETLVNLWLAEKLQTSK
jgi:hypothetical protein